MRRAAAAPGAAAATVEDRQLDVALGGERRQRLLRAVGLPGGGDVAAVLARVGVAEHHLEAPAAPLDERAEVLVVEQRRDGRGRLAEVGDRLEERDEREILANLPARQCKRAPQIVRPAVPETMIVSSAREPWRARASRTARNVACTRSSGAAS